MWSFINYDSHVASTYNSTSSNLPERFFASPNPNGSKGGHSAHLAVSSGISKLGRPECPLLGLSNLHAMKILSVKIGTELFEKILRGEKNFIVRPNDQDYNPRDKVLLREWNYTHAESGAGEYTGREAFCTILNIVDPIDDEGEGVGIKKGFIAFSFFKHSHWKNGLI